MLVISTCDATTDWAGTALTNDTDDKMEGTGSLVDTVATPTVTDWYNTYYTFAESQDWSAKKHILFWLICDRASAAFTAARLIIQDTSADTRYWNLTFSAGEWTAVKELLSTGDGESGTPDLTLVSIVNVAFQAADTTAFYKKIDHARVIVGSQGMIGDDYFMRL